MWPCISLAGKQMLSAMMERNPLSYSLLLDGLDRTTRKPHRANSVFQNGKFSYMPKPRGMPMTGALSAMGRSFRRNSIRYFSVNMLMPFRAPSALLE